MIRVIIGSVAAAIVMFVIGFVFYATPLSNIHIERLGDEQAAAIQQALAQNMENDGDGTVLVPNPATQAQQRMYLDGPNAMIHYNPSGFELGDTGAIVGGFIHMLISALILGAALYALSGHVREFRPRLVITGLFAVAAGVFMHLGAPVWYHQDWTYYTYVFVADTVMLIAGGAVIARWFLPDHIASEDRFGAEHG